MNLVKTSLSAFHNKTEAHLFTKDFDLTFFQLFALLQLCNPAVHVFCKTSVFHADQLQNYCLTSSSGKPEDRERITDPRIQIRTQLLPFGTRVDRTLLFTHSTAQELCDVVGCWSCSCCQCWSSLTTKKTSPVRSLIELDEKGTWVTIQPQKVPQNARAIEAVVMVMGAKTQN